MKPLHVKIAAFLGGLVLMVGALMFLDPQPAPPAASPATRPEVEAPRQVAGEGQVWSWGAPAPAPRDWTPPPVEQAEGDPFPNIGPAVAQDAPVPADARGASWVFERHPEVIDACLKSHGPPEDEVPADQSVTFQITVSRDTADGEPKMTGLSVLDDARGHWTPMLGCLAVQFQGARFEAPEKGVATLTWTLRRGS